MIYTFLSYGHALNCIAASTVAAYQTGLKTHWRFRSDGSMGSGRIHGTSQSADTQHLAKYVRRGFTLVELVPSLPLALAPSRPGP